MSKVLIIGCGGVASVGCWCSGAGYFCGQRIPRKAWCVSCS